MTYSHLQMLCLAFLVPFFIDSNRGGVICIILSNIVHVISIYFFACMHATQGSHDHNTVDGKRWRDNMDTSLILSISWQVGPT